MYRLKGMKVKKSTKAKMAKANKAHKAHLRALEKARKAKIDWVKKDREFKTALGLQFRKAKSKWGRKVAVRTPRGTYKKVFGTKQVRLPKYLWGTMK